MQASQTRVRPSSPGYGLGCPFWGCKDWVGSLYSRDARPADYLRQYASVFSAVEGNTTFYSTPSADTVQRWIEATPEHFHFCFKLPREITHDFALRGGERQLGEFFDRLAPLGPRLGPFHVQLPPSFGAEHLGDLAAFCAQLPREHDYAVELRRAEFHVEGDTASRFDELLLKHGYDRVVLDTRALRSGDAHDTGLAETRRRKPDLPVYSRPAIGSRPLLRFVGHEDERVTWPWVESWLETLRGWLAEGRRPYLFIHTPSNRYTPALARRLHAALEAATGDEPMPPWPGEVGESAVGQLSLL